MRNILQTGMLARLPVYPGEWERPSCAEVGLSTEAWKENIVADVQFVQGLLLSDGDSRRL